MRTTKDTAQFKKDYKRVARGQYRATLDEDLLAVVVPLATDQPLPVRTVITLSPANMRGTVNVTSSPTCC